MSYASRTKFRRSFDPWPGFVDVLSTLLMVVIFVLMVFSISQFFLSRLITDKDEAMRQLYRQIDELAQVLALERRDAEGLRGSLSDLSLELQAALAEKDSLSGQLVVVMGERDEAINKLGDLNTRLTATADTEKKLEDAYRVIDADKEKIQALIGDIAALQSLRDELTQKLLASEGKTAAEQQVSEEANMRLALLNRQILALREQLSALQALLDESEAKAKDQEVQIADLGQRLNMALANKVQELARYRSEFFGRLREVLGTRDDIVVVGDRFVFQSEVLFESGSATLGEQGKLQLARLGETLQEVSESIPKDIDWVLRVDGHTDKNPISSGIFPSNWELSAARAISVVKFLVEQGIPSNRLVAAGFAEFRPLDPNDTPDAFQRNRRIELKLDQR